MTEEPQGSAVVAGQLAREVRPRLWVVRVIREAYVLATDEEAALAQQREIERWEEPPRVTAEPAEGQHLRGWDDEPGLCMVYGSDKEISLATARRLYSRD